MSEKQWKDSQMEESYVDEYRLELENRIKNLLWTVSGDYTLEMKPDLEAFRRSKAVALYDGIKQGAFAKYFNKDEMGLYLVKKVYLHANEAALTMLAQLCIEEAVGERIRRERPGVNSIGIKAFEDILDREFSHMAHNPLGILKMTLLREYLDGPRIIEKKQQKWLDEIHQCRNALCCMDIIRVVDSLYNKLVEPDFEEKHGDLERVLAVTLEELTEFTWQDFLTEEMYEDTLEKYVQQITDNMTSIRSQEEEEKKEQPKKKTVKVLSPEALEKMYTYVELNFGKSYLSEMEARRMNHQMCRGIHADCSLYFTDGILQNPVTRNYQYEYARKTWNKNKYMYHDKHRTVKRNIAQLTDILRKTLVLRSETQEVLSQWGKIVPSLMWKVGRTRDNRLFKQELKADNMDFVVDVLIDASGSQRCRQEQVALQAYIISEALSNVDIPHRVMSYCTFWDYTILQRFREYDDDRSANQRIFEYSTSSNNRDGLAIKAIGQTLLMREEEKKILIVLSDGKPHDVIVNRPNARNPQPYEGKYAIRDTGFEVRRLRNQGVSVLGVFAGEEKELDAEKKIFGKDFAYIRTIDHFSRVVGRYLTKQLDTDNS